MDYLLLLRGINVGKNKRVPMADLRSALTDAGLTDVRSYINSGNLFFTTNHSQPIAEKMIAEVLTNNFDFPIPFQIITQPDLLAAVQQAPSWWGIDSNLRHNALFKLPDYNPDNDLWLNEHVTADYDQIKITPTVIFWSSAFKVNASRSFYAKIAGTPLYQQTSTRNYNTTRKLQQLLTEN
ncbi:DUF1697 domain-containing protein [Lactiplantibacillus herbarum]|uniref:DUF1697 domain-containing protein n=1 Tax=Lactiplantibacillus herbarum TaxID=1670446 RepID=UPI00064E62FC|nr:DUF1697 domain-containing protein [Lactiplantibacillus herbarum]